MFKNLKNILLHFQSAWGFHRKSFVEKQDTTGHYRTNSCSLRHAELESAAPENIIQAFKAKREITLK